MSHSVLSIIWSASAEGRGERLTLGELELQSQTWGNSHLHCQGAQISVPERQKGWQLGKENTAEREDSLQRT